MKRLPFWWLLWLSSACRTLEQQRQQSQTLPTQPAVLRAQSTFDPASREIQIACTITNQGDEPLALLYGPTLHSAIPSLNWGVLLTTQQGRQLTDCAAPIIKGRISPAREYTVLGARQQVALTIHIQAAALHLSADGLDCAPSQKPVGAGTYHLQVLYHDSFRRHRHAIASLQSSSMVLTLN